MHHRTGGGSCSVSQYRLPRNVIPASYELKLIPDIAKASFAGSVSIEVEVFEPTDVILLNAAELVIHSAQVSNDRGTSFQAAVSLDEKLERACLKVNGKIGKGKWRLSLSFSGILNDKLRGFYRSLYKDADGKEEVIASTQLQATDARRAFPCFDEPDFKATFTVSLGVDEELVALSNAAVQEVVDLGGGKKQVNFATTMKMSTYLVAFIVGKMTSTKALSVDGVDVRVHCVPGKEHLARFALEMAAFSLNYFNKYFGRPYPGGKKLDLVAIPDFSMGAMENLGCIIFRETALLVDHEHASQAELEWVAEVVAHEIAHMWFGDLVTMRWWHGSWLNEAFATFMSAKAMHAWKRHWGVWERFCVNRSKAMAVDALRSTRSVEFTVNDPSEAAAMFDTLTYEKGCWLMRMLEQYVGEEPFRQGIALYMERHAYANTEGADLWNALQTSTGIDVGKIMHNWIHTPGFPQLTLQEGDTGGSITIKQKPFKLLREAIDESKLWTVPIFIRAKTAAGIIENRVLLDNAETSIYLGEGLEWVLLNSGGHSFVRVSYSGALQENLTQKALPELSVTERFNLVADTWAQVMAGDQSVFAFVDLATLLKEETDPNVWGRVFEGLKTLHGILSEADKPPFEAFVRDLLRPCHERLGWTPNSNESIKYSELRGSIIQTLAVIGKDSDTLNKARAVYSAYKADPKSIQPNLVEPVLNSCAYFGDVTLYEELFQLFQKAKTPQEYELYLQALAHFQEPALVSRTLGYLADPTVVRTQDSPSVLGGLLGNPGAAQSAWSFIKEHWDKLADLYPESNWAVMCESVKLLPGDWEEDVRSFLSERDLKSAKQSVGQSLEQLQVKARFSAKEKTPLASRFCQK
ncbi:MAG: M1 family metallopeptidase [Candidatus Obscuribacterales bacterium]|nr:M1 family metallopeptidase [Candidatus Obscuribacterales bacterium]